MSMSSVPTKTSTEVCIAVIWWKLNIFENLKKENNLEFRLQSVSVYSGGHIHNIWPLKKPKSKFQLIHYFHLLWNIGVTLPFSHNYNIKWNIHWILPVVCDGKVGSAYFLYKTTTGDWTKFKNIITHSKKDILEHFKNIDTSQGSKKCIYNWVGGPTITINWLNSSITFYQ